MPDATIAGAPLADWEYVLDHAARTVAAKDPATIFRGLVEAEPGHLAPCLIVPAAELTLYLTDLEWSALHWLLVEQATMVWTVSRQLARDDPARPGLVAQAEWWKDLEDKLGAAIEPFATPGPLHTILADALAPEDPHA